VGGGGGIGRVGGWGSLKAYIKRGGGWGREPPSEMCLV